MAVAAVVASLLTATAAWAAPVSIVSIELSAGGHTGNWTAMGEIVGDTYSWDLTNPVTIVSSTDSQVVLGTIDQLSLDLDTDPFVALGFNVTAGAVPTNFSISSLVVGFPLISSPQAFATTQVGVTDLDSSIDGATLTGQFPGTKAYEARYNNGAFVFADLMAPVTAATDDSNSGNDRFPVAGRVPIGIGVFNIESQFMFQLTANDSASGTSRFDVIPEPSSFVLAGLAGLVLGWQAWRRRRRG